MASGQILISTEWEDDSFCYDQVAELMQKWFSGLLWSECHSTSSLNQRSRGAVGFIIRSASMNMVETLQWRIGPPTLSTSSEMLPPVLVRISCPQLFLEWIHFH